MLTPLKVTPSLFRATGYVPPIMKPIADAAAKGLALEDAILSITRGFGFESFMYGMCLDPRPGTEARQLVYTTLPVQWVHRYDACKYIDIDPRVRQITVGSVPQIWDQTTFAGKSPRIDAFLDDCARNGIASGVSLAVRDAYRRPTVMALNSAQQIITVERTREIASDFGNIMLFSQYLHELLMVPAIDKAVGPPDPPPSLTRRERECLSLGARGLGSYDISQCMAITPRTVQLHFDSARTKLGAANRQEAVALAIKHGIIVV